MPTDTYHESHTKNAIESLRDTDGTVWSTGIEHIGAIQAERIEQHVAQGEGDKWYYDVFFEDGSYYRCFNPVGVRFRPPAEWDNSPGGGF